MNIRRTICLVAAFALSFAVAVAQQNTLRIPDVVMADGEGVDLPVYLDNTADVVGLQFTIATPEGFALDETSARLTDRAASHSLRFKQMPDGSYMAMITSPENKPIALRTGAVMTVKLTTTRSASEQITYPLTLSQVVIASATGGNIATGYQSGSVVVTQTPDLAVEQVVADRSDYSPNSQMSLSFKVKNIGNLATRAGWREQFSLIAANGTEVALGSAYVSQTLGAKSEMSRQVDLTVPSLVGVDGPCQVRVQITAVEDPDERTYRGQNNQASTLTSVNIGRMLYLSPAEQTVEEQGGATLRYLLERSGATDNDETFTLNVSADGRITAPQSVTVGKGMSGAYFSVLLKANGQLDSLQRANLEVYNDRYAKAQASFNIVDDKLPALNLQLSKTDLTEGDSLTLTLTAQRAPIADTEVRLSCDLQRLQLPATLTLPAGQTVVTAKVIATDDDVPHVTETAELKAVAANYTEASALLFVYDNDMPTLELTLTPYTVGEGDGPTSVTAHLRRTSHTDKVVTIQLSDDTQGQLFYSRNRIQLDKGVSEATITLGPIDNATVDGERTATITAAVYMASCSCAAAPTSDGGTAQATLLILDNDGPTLTLSAAQSVVKEGGETSVTVARNTPPTEALVVSLSSDHDDALEYPATVTLPAGKTSTDFTVKAAASAQTADGFTAVFTATAEGFGKGTTWLSVSDQSMPDAVISNLTVTPAEALPGDSVTLTATLTNNGLAPLAELTTVNFYQGKTLLRTAYTQETLEVGASATLMAKAKCPEKVGMVDYYAVVNENGTTQELSYANNTSPKAQVSVVSPYAFTLSTDKQTVAQGDAVGITGEVTGNQAANADIEVYIINGGARETFATKTDAQGHFNYTWHPYATQSGHAVIGACYPGDTVRTALAEVDIYGLQRQNYSYITCKAQTGVPFQGTIPLLNPTLLPLSHITAEVIEKPDHIQVTLGNIAALGAEAKDELAFTLQSNDDSEGNDWEQVKVRITAAEGPSLTTTLYFFAQPAQAKLETDVAAINTTLQKTVGRDYSLTLTNRGLGATGTITFALPSWMKTVTPSNVQSLASGEQTEVVLHLDPTPEMELNVPVTGTLGINCEHGDGLSLPFRVVPVSDATGTLVIDVTDESAYYTEEKPHLCGATVKITDPMGARIIFQDTTNVAGQVSTTLPEGYYNVYVTADHHDSYASSVLVDPGTTTTHDVFIGYQGVTYSWSVEETDVEDEYHIVTTVDYETRVPAPVVVFNFPVIPYCNHVAMISVTNKGFIEAHNIELTLPENDEHMQFELLCEPVLPVLGANCSYVFPVRVTVDQEYLYDTPSMVVSSNSNMPSVNVPGDGGNKVMSKDKKVAGHSGCFVKYFKATRQKEVCNKKTGQMETSNETETYNFAVYYGNCSSRGVFGPVSPGDPRDPTKGPGGTKGPGSPLTNGKTNPESTTYFTDRLRTILLTGCTTECEDALAEAIIACYEAYDNCKNLKGKKLKEVNKEAEQCAAEAAIKMALGEEVDPRDCYKKYTGLIPGYACLESLRDCIENAKKAIKSCTEEYNRNKGKHAPRRADGQNDEPDSVNVKLESISLQVKQKQWIHDIYLAIYGDESWFNSTEDEMIAFQGYLNDILDDENHLHPTASRYDYKPECVSRATYDEFFNGWDTRWNDAATTQALQRQGLALDSVARSLGYSSLTESNDSADAYRAYLDKRLETMNGSPSVCASITLQFDQTMLLTRQAFRGHLTMTNGHNEFPVEDLKLSLTIKDMDGNLTTSREFQVNMEKLDVFTGELDMQSGWTLAPSATGEATILFIPTKYAAPEEPKSYSFGGMLSYTDPFSGLTVTRELSPVTMEVNPSPQLDLTYFMQRDILGDDPLTDAVEPMEEGEFSLLIHNSGYGEATNVRMTTNQPEIIDNEKGLLIEFELMSSQLNGGEKNLALGGAVATDFGNIPAQGSAVAQWWIRSSLLGHFNRYEVEATHVTSYGNPDLSLLGDVTIHELIRSIKTGDEAGAIGFLANDVSDLASTPDMLYLPSGQAVSVASEDVSIEPVSDTQWRLTIGNKAASPLGSWRYGNVIDPTYGAVDLKSVVRESDGRTVSERNCWQTHVTMRNSRDPLYENRIHIADSVVTSTETYLLTFEPRGELTLEVMAFEGVPQEGVLCSKAVDSVRVVFNKPIDPTTFTPDDITVRVQGQLQETSSIGISTEDNKSFLLDLTAMNALTGNGYYTLTVQTAGITDSEGFPGLTGKTASWTLYVNNAVLFFTHVTPTGAGTITAQKPHAEGILYGDDVVLTATANAGFDFASWIINGKATATEPTYTLTALGDMDVVASFTRKNFLVDIGVDGIGGTLSGSATGLYPFQTVLTIEALPDEGYHFKLWTINEKAATDSTATLTLLADSSMIVRAHFETDIVVDINSLFAEDHLTIYRTDGTLVKRDARRAELMRLPRGIYIVNGRKVVR